MLLSNQYTQHVSVKRKNKTLRISFVLCQICNVLYHHYMLSGMLLAV